MSPADINSQVGDRPANVSEPGAHPKTTDNDNAKVTRDSSEVSNSISFAAQIRQLDSDISSDKQIKKKSKRLRDKYNQRFTEAKKRIRSNQKIVNKLLMDSLPICEQALQAVQQQTQGPAQILTQQPEQQLEQDPEQQPEQQPEHQLGQEPEQPETELAQHPQPIVEPVDGWTSTDDFDHAHSDDFDSETFSTTETNIQSSSYDPESSSELGLLSKQYQLDGFNIARCKSLENCPSRALVHRFGNMEHQTVVAYGKEYVQFWDPVERSIVGAWNGDVKLIEIEQAEPVSSSVLAIVSRGSRENKRIPNASKLFFMNVNWSLENRRFTNLHVQQWRADPQAAAGISAVESVQSEDNGDAQQVSLFTGGLTDRAVFRRIFDISENEVTMVSEQQMFNEHRGIVSAMCHVGTVNSLIWGTTAGQIFVNDHDTGSPSQKYNMDDDYNVRSIVGCSYNPNLFLASLCEPRNEIRIFDVRVNRHKIGSVLTLYEDGCGIPTRKNFPAWNTDNDLIFVPMQRYGHPNDLAVINVWDPRWTKSAITESIVLHEDEGNVFSVDFTKSAGSRGSEMITASEDSIGFSTPLITRL
ncbi:hypothetical protein IW150_003188 [Coemansia sp. RSA 2607]|nr:hypothetical protein IW150_003188 [Coemansia sp. RSA 2607]KAJ2395356.1 hypothetical protein GGI05_001620 [Coemansia sp. RSA 2603]